MPEFNDVTALALLATVLFMGERWANKLVEALTNHLERQADALEECKEILLTIKESFSSSE